MSEAVIEVDNLSKRCRIGVTEEVPDTLGGVLANLVARPLKNLRRLRRLYRFGDGGHGAFDIIWTLKQVSFEVRRGEVLGIIGKNGAGKSTLLKVKSRITRPTSERSEMHGRVGSLLEVGTGKCRLDRRRGPGRISLAGCPPIPAVYHTSCLAGLVPPSRRRSAPSTFIPAQGGHGG